MSNKLRDRVMKATEFEKRPPAEQDAFGRGHYGGCEFENARLRPLIEKLAACAEELEYHCGSGLDDRYSLKPITALKELLGERQAKAKNIKEEK